jgi:hypothetical protein
MPEDIRNFGRELIQIFEAEYMRTHLDFHLRRVRLNVRTESFIAVGPWVDFNSGDPENPLWPPKLNESQGINLKPRPAGLIQLLSAKNGDTVRLERRRNVHSDAQYMVMGAELHLIWYRLNCGDQIGRWLDPIPGSPNSGWPLKLAATEAPVTFRIDMPPDHAN